MLCHLDLSELFVPLHPSGTSKPLWPSSCNTCVRRGQSTTAHTQAAAVPCAPARCPRNTRSFFTLRGILNREQLTTHAENS